MEQNDGGPAFPTSTYDAGSHVPAPGMSLRDWLAGQALVGLGDWTPYESGDGCYGLDHAEMRRRRAEWSYAQADAMLAARGGSDAR